MAKLSDRQRKQIIAEYVEGDGKVSQRSPAKKYNVCLSTISKILSDEKAEQSVHIKKTRKKTDREDAHFPPSRRNRCGRRARFSAIRISLFYKVFAFGWTPSSKEEPSLFSSYGDFSAVKGCLTERGAARFLPLQATASAEHNFCRRSVFTYIILPNRKNVNSKGEFFYARYTNIPV